MLELSNPKVIRDLLARHKLSPQKALGQNFITNPALCPRMAEEGGAMSGVGALEIGPGLGVLTAELAKRCDKVTAVEIDRGLLPLLSETLSDFSNVNILHADLLKLDLGEVVRDAFGSLPVIVCANLPYYITTPILMHLLESGVSFQSITVMMQKETAQRICAPLPSRGAGAITVSIAWRAQAKILFDVSRGSFLPAPDVDSAVIQLIPRVNPPYPVADESTLFAVIRHAFAQRRKTLLNCLSNGFFLPKDVVTQILETAEIPPQTRAEALDLAAFARLANAMSNMV
ncbi:MAG: 16S rRNA (adenine(1518)-N(6)/adenine(1519)-N(6))-dimethyltransferase RsmA [Oscillospiraceae bacterium]|nr:16S rRNA (adenine(1518)-N(6)/adenine(1519)-N(6))-dimethyltransferase RsmA [Oscillospiraceae bacterium]